MKCLLIAFIQILGLTIFALAQDDSLDSGGPLAPQQAAYDVTFYDLHLTIAPEQQYISGSNTITARVIEPISDLVLDFISTFTIDSVRVKNQDQLVHSSFERDGSKIHIDLLEQRAKDSFVTAQVFYRGTPRVAPNPPWGGGFTWTTTPSGDPWVSVSCQNNGADIWWPCKDHPSDEPDSMALTFTVPENLQCISNGQLRRVVENSDSTHTFYWFVSTPINNYGVSFYLAPFENVYYDYKSTASELFPLNFYYLPENIELHREFSRQIPDHVRFLEETLGPYPFRIDKYAAVEAPYLGMEHQSCIAYGNYSGNDVFGYDQGFDALHFHELAHEWWGNMLTASDWKDFWLHEGFATYMEALYAGYLNGQDGYDAVMAHFASRISNRRAMAPQETRTTNQMYGGDIYFKGAWVLHTLRYLLGDALFFESLQRFLYPDPALKMVKDGSHCRLVSSEDFIKTVEQVSNQELHWFFQVYLRQAQPPVLQTWLTDQHVHLMWKIQNDLPFFMNVPVQLEDSLYIVDMSDGEAQLELDPFVPPEIDPHHQILMRVERITKVAKHNIEQISGFSLSQNYPNPFNAETTIEFTLPQGAFVDLTIHNLRGELVEIVAHEELPAGVHQMRWDAKQIPSGTYTCKLKADDFVDVIKLTLLK